MRLKGKVLWYDNRDGYGQIKTDDGARVYFDASTLTYWAGMPVRHGYEADFLINESIKRPVCAADVRLKIPATLVD